MPTRNMLALLLCVAVAALIVVPLWTLVAVDASDRFYRQEMVRWVQDLKDANPGLKVPPLPKKG